MQKLLLAEWSVRLKPLYGPFHRDMLNLSWLVESLRSSMRSGFLMLQSEQGLEFVPVLEGKAEALRENFELISFYQTLENFVINAFSMYEKHYPPLYSDRPLWINLDSISFNTREFFKKLQDFEVTGYLEVENRVKLRKGHFLLQKGFVLGGEYGGLKGLEALRVAIEDMEKEVCYLRVYELPEELVAFFVSPYELVAVYESIGKYKLKSYEGYSLLVGVSPDRYEYALYCEGESLSEHIKDEHPFYELYITPTISSHVEPIDPTNLVRVESKIRTVNYDPNLSIIYFCPACWSSVSKDDVVCPACGYDLMEFHQLPYEYKLIMALEHPVKEMRKNVIYTIGKKDLKEAIPHLEVIINKETDPLILMEVVDALSKMTSPEAIRLLRLLAQHRYPIVRSKALIHLNRRLKNATA